MQLKYADKEHVVLEITAVDLSDLEKIVCESTKIDTEVLLLSKERIIQVISFIRRPSRTQKTEVLLIDMPPDVFRDMDTIVGTVDAVDAYPEMSLCDARLEEIYKSLRSVYKTLADSNS